MGKMSRAATMVVWETWRVDIERVSRERAQEILSKREEP